jgi:enamine deaminase RidA (YjgF/YER057c/UK114 family)
MKRMMRILAVAVLFGAAAVAGNPAAREEQGMSTQSAKTQESKGFRIFNPEGLAKPTVGYSQVAEVTEGKVVYIAGQVALDKAGNLVGKDDFRAQAQQVFENLKGAVEGAGGDFSNVVKMNYYCAASVDPAQVVAVREIRDKYVNTANPPTSTFVFVQRLVRPEWLIEVEAVAVVKK